MPESKRACKSKHLAYEIASKLVEEDDSGECHLLSWPGNGAVVDRRQMSWNDHMRGMRPDFLESWRLHQWLVENVQSTGSHADAVTVHELWVRYCVSTGSCSMRSMFGTVVKGITAVAFGPGPLPDCACGMQFGHIHGLRIKAGKADVALSSAEAEMKLLMMRRRWESAGAERVCKNY